MWRDLWAYRKRAVVVAASVLSALLVAAVVVAASSGAGRHRAAGPAAQGVGASPAPSATGYDRSPWEALPPVTAQASGPYPAIAGGLRAQPDLFVRAFGTELLTRDYRHSNRTQLLDWALSESASLSLQQVPLSQADRDTALLVSITDPAWDNTPTAIVPTQGAWLSLAAQQAYSTVSDVRVEQVPDFPPAGDTFGDPMTLDRLYTATVSLHTSVAGKPVLTRSSVAFEVVIGTSRYHGRVFGAAQTQHYVVTDVP